MFESYIFCNTGLSSEILCSCLLSGNWNLLKCPGKTEMNVSTSISGSQGGKWSKYRGELKEFVRKPATDIPGLETKYQDYEKGFHDPTVDQENVPHPPRPSSWRSQVDLNPSDYVKTDF